MYKLTDSPDVIQLLSGVFIPRAHPLWVEYEDWLADGNEPEPFETLNIVELGLIAAIDSAADAARNSFVVDPLRALEYEKTATDARTFAEAGYPSDSVPRSVSAWVNNGRSARQAAESILLRAAAYTDVLYRIRELRLQAKESVRAAIAAGGAEHAKAVAAEAITAIRIIAKGDESTGR
ncbi:hypothetical protein [Pseudomonas sp. FeS53a]|jgi:hypothetical protein|uniref:hypothetical protein n=1 Tax=Pseudomonas sp. FeS53a TaxID=1604022 RepID=UPI0005CAC939|nr:hypothetical protein [Pseudomonas sp. FeS53a]